MILIYSVSVPGIFYFLRYQLARNIREPSVNPCHRGYLRRRQTRASSSRSAPRGRLACFEFCVKVLLHSGSRLLVLHFFLIYSSDIKVRILVLPLNHVT